MKGEGLEKMLLEPSAVGETGFVGLDIFVGNLFRSVRKKNQAILIVSELMYIFVLL